MSESNLAELSDEAFHATFGPRMIEIQVSAEPAALLQATAADVLLNRAAQLEEVSLRLDRAYSADPGPYIHYLFWYGVTNVYLVLVAEATGGALYGYHRLDLNEKYGLPSPPDPVWNA